MSMKKFNLMMWQGLVLSALALGFASCEPSDKPCPNKKEADGNTDQGVTVMLEMENVETGETTRTALGENGYSFTAKDGGGDVEAGGLGFHRKPIGSDDIDVKLTYYAKENVVFQGWSWRYSGDPVGTHRGKTDATQNDYVATPALQPESGVRELALGADATTFTCKYRPGTDNTVYVKVRYIIRDDLKGFPSMDDLSSITCIPPISHPLLPPSTIQDRQRLTYKVGCSLFINGIAYPEQIDGETGKSYAYKGWKEYYDFLVDIKDQVKKKSLAGTQRVPNPLKPGEWIVKVPYKDQVETMERVVNRWKLIGSFIENDMLLWD